MTSSIPVEPAQAETAEKEEEVYTRFSLSQRIEHFILLVSFTTLGITGLVQKFAASPISQGIISLIGNIERTRIVHRGAAVVLMAVSAYHIVAVLYRLLVLRSSLSMLPLPSDFRHLIDDVMFYLGRRKRKAYYGRYSYAEKMEYLAVVWGTLIMAITGFMMWNPIATTQLLPGEFVPAAKAAHGGEALLAVLAIILWHFYHVHIRTFNKSMFTGVLTREEMEDEHPAELAEIEAGRAGIKPPPEVIRKRERAFFPFAVVLLLIFTYGLFRFVTFEETALSFVPPGETAQVFVPITPTPLPTPLPTATPLPGEAPPLISWEQGFAQLFAGRCGTCHVQGSFGELSLATYEGLLAGGVSGPAIIPGEPQDSVLVQIQQTGDHPGQLTASELDAVIAWIEAGAPEE